MAENTSIIEKIEGCWDSLGLMTGEGADKKRMIIGALGTGFVLTYLKPEMFFHAGQVRPWRVLESDETQKPTHFTLWHAMLVGAFISGVLI